MVGRPRGSPDLLWSSMHLLRKEEQPGQFFIENLDLVFQGKGVGFPHVLQFKKLT